MTLNGVMAVILRYYIEFGRFGANYDKVYWPLLAETKMLWRYAQRSPRKSVLTRGTPVSKTTIWPMIFRNSYKAVRDRL